MLAFNASLLSSVIIPPSILREHIAMTQSRGHFVWHELLTPNKESATAFYPRVVSWKTQAWEKARSYPLGSAPSGALGVLGTIPPDGEAADARMGWLPFIGVADVDE